jgi:hypothetical protein
MSIRNQNAMRHKVSFKDSDMIPEDAIGEFDEVDKTSESWPNKEITDKSLRNIQNMMQEENLTLDQKMALKMIRGSFKMADSVDILTEEQLRRTLSIYCLATQISLETILIGVNPSSIFSSLARFGSRYVKRQNPEESESMLIWPERKLLPIDGTAEELDLKDPFDDGEIILPMMRLNVMSPSFPNIIRPDLSVRMIYS